jgi:hypothetical protein
MATESSLPFLQKLANVPFLEAADFTSQHNVLDVRTILTLAVVVQRDTTHDITVKAGLLSRQQYLNDKC